MMVKVCGMRDPDNIRAVEQLGVQWMGFIFWPRSSRYVSQRPAYLPTQCRRVGVFVDADPDDVRRTVGDYGLDVIQLHGHESPEYVEKLRGGVSIIKAFSIATADDLRCVADYEGLADYFLFDTKASVPGGTGRQFDWSVLDAYTGQTPFLLSGGIGPGDALRLRAFHHPQLAGIDLNSRFETSPAIKDINQLKRFIHEQNQ